MQVADRHRNYSAWCEGEGVVNYRSGRIGARETSRDAAGHAETFADYGAQVGESSDGFILN
jgi:hypothetical protein